MNSPKTGITPLVSESAVKPTSANAISPNADAPGKTINIRPNVSILSVLRHLNYKPWFALAEFVDNAIQSFVENEKLLRATHGPDFRLRVSIETSRHDGGWIIIRDNAAGIALSEFPRAFKAAEVPIDRSGLSEFGMGMKSAAFWFSGKWTVRTKAYGDLWERSVAFDVSSILNEKREELDIVETPAGADAHFTEIVLSKLHTPLQPKVLAKIKDHLSSIFRSFIADNRLVLKVDEETLAYERPVPLCAPYFKTPREKPVTWKKDIDFDFGGGQRVTGFAALFETASTTEGGFSLFRRNRLIEGSCDEGYRPEPIFGAPNSFVYQRLFGELHLEGFEVTHTKDGFKWQDYEEIFLSFLNEHLDAEPLPLLKQAEGHRVRQKPEDYTKGATTASTRTAGAIEEHVPPVIAGQLKQSAEETKPTPLPVAQSVPATREIRFKVEGQDWIVTLELTTDPAISDWLSLQDNAATRGVQAMEIKVRLSLVHPFMQQFGGVTAQQIEPLLRIAAAIALSEVTARSSGVKQAGVLRRNINDFLRHGLIDPITP